MLHVYYADLDATICLLGLWYVYNYTIISYMVAMYPSTQFDASPLIIDDAARIIISQPNKWTDGNKTYWCCPNYFWRIGIENGLTFFYADGELVGGVDIVSHLLWKDNECKSEDVQEMVLKGTGWGVLRYVWFQLGILLKLL